jgi:hypothetical protein
LRLPQKITTFCTALLYGRAGRFTAKNGGFRPGQDGAYKELPMREAALYSMRHALLVLSKVRETPSWPRSWANFSLL